MRCFVLAGVVPHATWSTALASVLLVALSGTASGQVPTDPLSQMEVAFKGDFTRAQIKSRLDRALQLYRLPITAENYSRAGSTLVALRKEIGPQEMDILDYMIRSHVPGVRITFPEAAGIAAAALARPGQDRSAGDDSAESVSSTPGTPGGLARAAAR
ncbi:MAG: hypothetical protein QGM45_12135 [Anaerolineales bacterium]|nr:hypothetical protein [Anaerolineales bacterium]